VLGSAGRLALAIGAAVSLSSTAIVMPILTEQKRQHFPGRPHHLLGLLFQDLAVAPILVTLTLLGRRGVRADLHAQPARGLRARGPWDRGPAGDRRLVLRPMLRSVARAKSEELFVAALPAGGDRLGPGQRAHRAFHGAGRFIAACLLAETEFRHEVEVTIEPFKGLLLGSSFSPSASAWTCPCWRPVRARCWAPPPA